MGRKSSKRPYHAAHRPLDMGRAMGGLRFEEGDDGMLYHVRTVRGDKPYRCPGCQGTIAPGLSHVVAWTEDGWRGAAAGLEERRHWHSACWSRRNHLF